MGKSHGQLNRQDLEPALGVQKVGEPEARKLGKPELLPKPKRIGGA